ncbi:MAG: TlpA family protein disulfide reductase [Bradyrhizobium icense]|jgi:thiol-disulfide isomerase/thioredoxin|nr:MAG: TlpA family protein disulfide reductase [Bradyrhizobium icense]
MRREFLAVVVLLVSLMPAPASDGETQLKPFGRGSWQELMKTHSGRPTIVHFWGVTCGPCKIEMPQLGAFMKENPGIDMVMISADVVPDLPAASRAMLERSGLELAENWIFEGSADRLRAEIDPTWQGDIPRTLLIGRDGEMTTIEGAAEMDDLKNWSERQLAATK